MTIDISNVGVGHDLGLYELNVLRSGHIFQNIKNINDKKFNYIIVSIDVYNILENHLDFKRADVTGDSEGVYFVGTLLEYNVYACFHLDPLSILLSYDKSIRRDIRIDSILNNSDVVDNIEVQVKL